MFVIAECLVVVLGCAVLRGIVITEFRNWNGSGNGTELIVSSDEDRLD
jgi:hypothetical protein